MTIKSIIRRLAECPIINGYPKEMNFRIANPKLLDVQTVVFSATAPRNPITKLLNKGIFIGKGWKNNLCLEEYSCHVNAAMTANENRNYCVFWGFGNDYDYGWQEHSWIVNDKGDILETWLDDIKTYFGIPNYDVTPKRNHAACRKAEKVLKREDESKGCRIPMLYRR